MARKCAQAWDPPPAAVDADDSSMSDSATVIEDDRVPESDPVNIIVDKPPVHPVDSSPYPKPAAVSPVDPVPAAVKVVDKPLVKVSDKPPDKVSDKPPEKPDPVPAADTVKEWDSKANAHLRLQVKTVFSSRDIALSYSDLRTWPENDLRDVCNLFCEMLSVRQDYLVDFVFGIVKSYWNNAKKTV